MISISNKTLNDLEFPTIRKQLSEFCVTELGREKADKLSPFDSPLKTLFALHQTQEYKSSAYEDAHIPNHGFEAVDTEIHLLEIENSVLELSGFRKIVSLSETTNTQLRFFNKNSALYPSLHKTTSTVELTTVLNDNIHRVIDRFGQVKNDASPLLQQIRRSLTSVRHQINASFTADMNTYQAAGYLDEIKESLVDNHQVLAVSAMHRRKVKGAILGRSKTGSIVYIQPENTLRYARELNNLIYEEQEEVNRILRELTELIRPYRALLVAYQNLLSEIDLIAAKVKYGETMNAILPKIVKKRDLYLKNAFHPLLYLANNKEGKTTYSQDIHLHHDSQIIVISGPNAGGKSITLKTIGLLQVMLQSGLLVPVHEYSRMCFFTRVLTDIGDHQSIENHLSTYSYRLKNMRYFLEKCDKNTLFLIDEFGTGSDPELGGALAETFLEVFYERGAYGVITTHYANLKKLAQETEGISNANMRFDSRSLEPEFKLQLGEAGSSFTFEVAQKNGIRYSLINRAKKKVERGKIRFDKSIAKLQQERSKLEKTTKKLNTAKVEAAEHTTKLSEKNKRVQQKLENFQELYDNNQRLIYLGQKLDKMNRRYAQNQSKKELIAEVLKVATIENSKRKKQNKKQQQQEKQRQERVQREAEKRLQAIREQKKIDDKHRREEAVKAEKKRIASLALNDRVRIEGSQAIGTIDRIEKGKAVVNYGMFTTETDVRKLELVSKKR